MPEIAMLDAPEISRFIKRDSTAEYLPLLEKSLGTLAKKLRVQVPGIPVDELCRIEEYRGKSKEEARECSPQKQRQELMERVLMLLTQQDSFQEHILTLRTASPDQAKQHVSMVLLERATLKPLAGLSLDQGLPQTIPVLQKQIQLGNTDGQRRVEQFKQRSQQGVTLEHCIQQSPRGIVKTSVEGLPLLYLTLSDEELLQLAGSFTENNNGTKSATKTQQSILRSIIKSLRDQCARMKKLNDQGGMHTPSYSNISTTLGNISDKKEEGQPAYSNRNS